MPVSAYFCHLTQPGLLRFAGTDAQGFLQGQLSCDVAALQPLQATYGSYSTPKGRMLASFLLWRVGADYFMQLPRALCEPIRKRLSMYVLRSKVQVTEVSETCAPFGLCGDHIDAALQSAGLPVATAPLKLIESSNALLLRLDAGRCLILAAIEQADPLKTALATAAAPAAESVWDLATIHAGIPIITAATQEAFVPQMANLDRIGGVSFSKGCYPGQEIVARMHYLGKLKQRMVLAHVDSATLPQPAQKLYSSDLDGQSSGAIVNAAPAATGGFDVLAVVHTSSLGAVAVKLDSVEGPELQLLTLPYPLETNSPS
ncbi:MAG: folate-binding protein [Betaproteobacteria bacterium]